MTGDLTVPANDTDDHDLGGDDAAMVAREDAALEKGDHLTALTSTMLRVSTKAWETLIWSGLVDAREMTRWLDDDTTGGWTDAVPILIDRLEARDAGSGPRAMAEDAAVRVLATCEDVRSTLLEIVDLMKQVDAQENDVTINADIFAEVVFWGAALGAAAERLNAVLAGVYNAPAELQFTRERLSHGGHIATAKRRARREDHKRHVVELANERLSAPLPTGRAKWTASLIAGEVTSAWKLDGLQPMPSTIQALVKEAVAEGEIVLPA